MLYDLDKRDLAVIQYAVGVAWEVGVKDEQTAAALMNLRIKLQKPQEPAEKIGEPGAAPDKS